MGKMSVKFGLMMVLTGVIVFLVRMIASYQKKFTIFGSPCVYECVVQYGSRSVGLGGLKGFSRFFSDVGDEPR